MIIEGKPGVQQLSDGALATIRLSKDGALMAMDAHGRFQEAAYRGALFSAGMTITSISNATFTTATLGATCTPIIGIWNASTNKNCVILQARVQTIVTAATATGPGAYMWATAVGQTAISTGITPLNRLTLLASGSVAKGFANTALTGLSGNLTVQEASGINPEPASNFSEVGTAAGFVASGASAIIVEPIDGAFIVPPGGVLALLATTNAPVAISAASSLLWEEIPV